jgi:hypothetical protein
MSTAAFGRYTFGLCAVAAMLAGCGGSLVAAHRTFDAASIKCTIASSWLPEEEVTANSDLVPAVIMRRRDSAAEAGADRWQ